MPEDPEDLEDLAAPVDEARQDRVGSAARSHVRAVPSNGLVDGHRVPELEGSAHGSLIGWVGAFLSRRGT